MPRIAVVKKELCSPQNCGGYLCIRLCPVNRMGKECIVEGPDKKVKIDEKLCTGCAICQNRCPFEAIGIINLPAELAKKPVHQYGQNGFHLYNLPAPIFGKVVGILGKNGIGKSTAIKILAGVLKPNLGTDKEASYDELIRYFKGSEAQVFFEKLKKGEIKVSYKPQQVDLIPKTAKGKVIDLLKRADEKGKLNEVAEILELNDFLNNDISAISGGELQRVAVAATALKNANLYIFDEPNNYLDVRQRINVSRFIRSLADEKTAVMVVEHDLIILDYITDLVHITYGKEGCYGIVSMPRPTRTGINVYLDGYLKEENVRFREKTLEFSGRAVLKKKKTIPLSSWKDVEAKLGSFVLCAKEGTIMRDDVVGVLGQNGIGKTSFVKILAHVLKPNKGVVDEKVVVSYKPQYLDSGSEQLVASVLKNAVENYEVQLVRPLELKPLLLKQINQLSGGELQRVAIAHCLSHDADLYLLDEPSAYLDVEQRLVVSKVIRDFAEQRECSILVVDHDLMFISDIARSLLVFEGVPARHGEAKGPFDLEEGMNLFLKGLGITMRRDVESKRPRINKEGSRLDKEQKEKGRLFY